MDHYLVETFGLLINQAWHVQTGMGMHSYPSRCFWQCKTGSYTLKYWFCRFIFKRIGSNCEMIAVCPYSFSHEVQKGTDDSVIRVTQWRINTVWDTLLENMAHLKATCQSHTKELKSQEMLLFFCGKGFNAQQSFLAFTVSCVKWT